MKNLNIDIKKRILEFLKKSKHGASSSEIAKNIGHNRITVTKYLEIMKAHRFLTFDEVAQAKLWYITEKTTKKKILIVDDEPHIVELVKLSLMSERFDLLEAHSGLDAIEKISREAPNLVILDLMMPGINGYEVCQRLKQDVLTQHIPIMILSAKGELKDKLRSINMGADDYLTKPFDPLELEARVNNLLITSDEETDINPITKIPGKIPLIESIGTNAPPKISLIMINGMKTFRKKYGARKGNEIIILFSRMLKDKLPEGCAIFHLIGDRFIVTGAGKNYADNVRRGFKSMIPYMYVENSTNKISLNIETIKSLKDRSALLKKIET